MILNFEIDSFVFELRDTLFDFFFEIEFPAYLFINNFFNYFREDFFQEMSFKNIDFLFLMFKLELKGIQNP